MGCNKTNTKKENVCNLQPTLPSMGAVGGETPAILK